MKKPFISPAERKARDALLAELIRLQAAGSTTRAARVQRLLDESAWRGVVSFSRVAL